MNANHFSNGVFYGKLWSRSKQIKERLVEEYGKCYWCKIQVKIYPHENGMSLPDDTATLDHLKSKNAGREKGENTPKVLSCRKCNQQRAINEKQNKHDINRTTGI